jgi:AraC family transcriptional regulator, ethanolamine operon transcriptional activator
MKLEVLALRCGAAGQGEAPAPGVWGPAAPFVPGLAARCRFEDFDELDDLTRRLAWDTRSAQLTRGRLGLRLAFVQTARVQLSVVRREQGFRVEGLAPAGTVTCGVPVSGDFRVRGARIRPEQVAVAPPGAPVELHAAKRDAMLHLSVDGALLQRVAAAHGVALPDHGPVVLLPAFGDEGARRQFLRTAGRALAWGIRDPEVLVDPRRAAVLEDALVAALLGAVERAAPWRRTPLASERIARRADELLRAHLDRPIAVWQVAEALGVSVRTVHASFLRHYGITPKAYLNALRLVAARRDLKAAAPGTRVADVATRWSFFHLGRFSGDYQRQFGESPSATLRAASGPQRRTFPGEAVRTRAPRGWLDPRGG